MKRTVKILFVIFNIVLFLSNYIFVAWFPSNLLFGWLPAQLAFMSVSMLFASLVWGLYFTAFFKTQKHVDLNYVQEEYHDEN